MKKKMMIDGMMCEHCQSRVAQALNALPKVTARVELKDKAAYLDLRAPVTDDVLRKAVTDVGYTVTAITEE